MNTYIRFMICLVSYIAFRLYVDSIGGDITSEQRIIGVVIWMVSWVVAAECGASRARDNQ